MNSEFAPCSWPSLGSVFLFGFFLRWWAKQLISDPLVAAWSSLARCVTMRQIPKCCLHPTRWSALWCLYVKTHKQEPLVTFWLVRWFYCVYVFLILGIPGWNIRVQVITLLLCIENPILLKWSLYNTPTSPYHGRLQRYLEVYTVCEVAGVHIQALGTVSLSYLHRLLQISGNCVLTKFLSGRAWSHLCACPMLPGRLWGRNSSLGEFFICPRP